MPKPTQAEVAELVGRLRECAADDDDLAPQTTVRAHAMRQAADALEALAVEGAEPVANTVLRNLAAEVGSVVGLFEPELRQLAGNTNVACLKRRLDEADAYLNAAPPAKPAGELPQLPEPIFDDPKGHWHDLYDAEQMRAYALRALRERA